jgi:hypothetical protein
VDLRRQEHGGTTLVPHPQGAAMPCIPRAVIAARHPPALARLGGLAKRLTV